ncbi:hypothetical protein Tco_1026321 [Tanacetum coccineum]
MSLQSILTLYLLLFNLSHGWGFGLSDCARGEVIGVMGSGEGYGLAVEWTRDSGLELETVGKQSGKRDHAGKQLELLILQILWGIVYSANYGLRLINLRTSLDGKIVGRSTKQKQKLS